MQALTGQKRTRSNFEQSFFGTVVSNITNCFIRCCSQPQITPMEAELPITPLNAPLNTYIPIQNLFVKHFGKQAFFSQSDLEQEKYGNKHTNLARLRLLVRSPGFEGVEVPFPHGISSGSIEEFFEKHALGITEHWQKLNSLFLDCEEKYSFLQREDVKRILESLTLNISEAFERAKNEFSAFPELNKWLASCDNFLMVRSTGNEDSHQVANAGGNISKAYVSPNRVAFCNAAKEVVISYFSENSLQNLIAASINPFAEKPNMAVTAQDLIGESVTTHHTSKNASREELPISGVLFSNEPLFVGDEKFRCMKISATYGHGEGVVGGQGIGTDTAHLLVSESKAQNLYVLYDNSDKPQRLAPVRTEEGVELQLVENPPNLRRQPVLSEKHLSTLYAFSLIVEECFEQPTDMEFVLKGETLYPVQARPVNRPSLTPTYLNTKKTPLSLKSFQGEILVPGKASAVAANKEEICFADTLKEAEKAYRGQKAVIVFQREPANSHPVVNFSGLGVPCLYVDKSTSCAIKTHPDSIVLCMQEGTASLWDPLYGKIEDFIAEGFTSHPAQVSVCLPVEIEHETLRRSPPAPQEIKELLMQIRGAATNEIALKALATLRAHPFVTSLKEKLPASTLAQISQTNTVLQHLSQKIEAAFDEVQAVLQKSERLHALFHIKALSALLIKDLSSCKSVGEYSRISIAPYVDDAVDLAKYQANFQFPVRLANIYLAGNAALDPSSKAKWQNFVKNLEQRTITADQEVHLRSIIRTLESAKMLPIWLSLFFQGQSLDEVLGTFPPSDERKIVRMSELEKEIKRSKNQIRDFSTPSSFKDANQRLQRICNRLIAIFNEEKTNLSPITSLMVLNTLNEAVDLYDLSIKQMKASSSWKQEEKVPIFKMMLKGYLSLFDSMIPHLSSPPINLNAIEPAKYLETLKDIFENLPTEGALQLLPSEDFSVAAALLGVNANFSRHMPKTLEDFFTLVHQNLLALNSSDNTRIITPTLIDRSKLSEKLKKALKLMGNLNRYLSGFVISENRIQVKYNVPLRTHSAQLVLNFDMISEEMTLQCLFLGLTEQGRWEVCAYIAQVLNTLEIFILDAPLHKTDQELIFTWRLDTEQLIPILEEFKNMCDISFEYSFDGWLPNFYPTVLVDKILGKYSIDKEKLAFIIEQSENKNTVLHNTLEFLYFKLSDPLSDQNNFLFWFEKMIRDNDSMVFQYIKNSTQYSFSESLQKEVALLIPRLETLVVFEDLFENTREILKLCESLLSCNPTLEIGFMSSFAEKHLNSPQQEIRLAALNCLSTLNNEEKQLAAAKKGVEDPCLRIKSSSLYLFRELVRKNLYFEEAHCAAQKGLNDPDKVVRTASYYVFIELIGKEFSNCYKQALQLAETCNPDNKYDSYELLLSFSKKGLYPKQTHTAAAKGIKQEDNAIKKISYQIYQEFVKRGCLYQEALAAAELEVNRSESKAYELFNCLVDQDQGIEQALNLVILETKYFKSPIETKKLFEKLFAKDADSERCLEALCTNGLEHEYWGHQEIVVDILRSYFKNNTPKNDSPSVIKIKKKLLDMKEHCHYNLGYSLNKLFIVLEEKQCIS